MKTLNLIFRETDKDNFDRIKSGEKLIETRAGLPEYLQITDGDTLLFSCGENTTSKIVSKTHHFQNIAELIAEIGIEQIMPAGTSEIEAITKWNSFPGYPERIEQYGIIAWELR